MKVGKNLALVRDKKKARHQIMLDTIVPSNLPSKPRKALIEKIYKVKKK